MTDFSSQWNDIVKRISSTFRLTREETEVLERNAIARLVAAIPYLAGCDNPDRSAVGNVASYIVAKNPVMRDIFDHRSSDDRHIMGRLWGISHFEGGDKRIIQRGRNLLLLTMVSNYGKDQTADDILGKYNPVSRGIWDHQELASRLIDAIQAVPCPEMDEIFSIDEGTEGWWDPAKQDEIIESKKSVHAGK